MEFIESPQPNQKLNSLTIYAKNLTGLGASRFFASIHPYISSCHNEYIKFRLLSPATRGSVFVNLIRGFLFFLDLFFVFRVLLKKTDDLLVLGDYPIVTKARQTLFLQNALLIIDTKDILDLYGVKLKVKRKIFRNNLKYVDKIVVQSNFMKKMLVENFNIKSGLITVLPCPVQEIERIENKNYSYSASKKYRILYPSACYPHKNHILLNSDSLEKISSAILNKLEVIVTCDNKKLSFKYKFVKNIGLQSQETIWGIYKNSNILLNLSQVESQGFSLVEAMKFGLIIICPNLPYAREICGNKAIYFNVDDNESLAKAIISAAAMVENNSEIDWIKELERFQLSWRDFVTMLFKTFD